LRGLSVYETIAGGKHGEILGFNVPDLLGADHGLRVMK